jgi:iron complex outermembrane recepter protein
MSMETDTIKINEVVISRKKTEIYPLVYKNLAIDSAILADYSNSSLAGMLSGQSLMFVKSYGMGGVASPSLRGTGATQTVIDWNGININGPMLGQTDLSLIPAGLIDDVHVYFGGASMLLNDGGIGGAINLETKPDWNERTVVTLNTGTGSFGERSGLLNIKTGTSKFQSVTKGYLEAAENNFRYFDNESGDTSVWKTRTNSQVSQRGFIQELYFKNSINSVSARIWYQSSDRHIPPNLVSTDGNGKQFDEALRIMLNDNLTLNKSSYYFTGAWLMGRLNYSDLHNDSRSLAKTIVLKAERESHPWHNTNLRIGINNELVFVNSNIYDKVVHRNTGTFTVSFEKESTNRIGMTLLLREILMNHSILIPDFSAGILYRIIENREYYLKANVSRNSRIPTTNDLYYPAYGNPNLKNEYSFTYEVTGEMNEKLSSLINVRSDLSLFHSSIKNLIQWNPVTSVFWTPNNINRVSSTGLESDATILYSVNKFSAGLNVGYSYTKSAPEMQDSPNDNSKGKQIIYIPVNQANSSIRLAYGIAYATFGTSFTGKRYTSKDDLTFLPYYIISNSITGIKLPLHTASLDLSLNVNNLFDFRYQSIAHYPMPGRSYFIKILVQFIK